MNHPPEDGTGGNAGDRNAAARLESVAPGPRRLPGGLTRRSAAVVTAAGLMTGGLLGGYMVTHAATPSPSAGSGAATSPTEESREGGHRDGARASRAEDEQQVADAIGISLGQLQAEERAGSTIAAIARNHSVDPQKVIDALVAAESKEIDAAVTAGTITQAQGDADKAATTARVTGDVNGVHREGSGHGGRRGEDDKVVADAIGVSTAQLQTELAAGRTIAQVATAHGVAVSKVISALADSENAEIDQRVSSGQLSAAQGATAKSGTTQRATDEVNGVHPAGHGGHDGIGSIPGAPGGGAPSA